MCQSAVKSSLSFWIQEHLRDQQTFQESKLPSPDSFGFYELNLLSLYTLDTFLWRSYYQSLVCCWHIPGNKSPLESTDLTHVEVVAVEGSEHSIGEKQKQNSVIGSKPEYPSHCTNQWDYQSLVWNCYRVLHKATLSFGDRKQWGSQEWCWQDHTLVYCSHIPSVPVNGKDFDLTHRRINTSNINSVASSFLALILNRTSHGNARQITNLYNNIADACNK